MNIDRLPYEIMLRIFGFIDDFQDMGRLERVCRMWRNIALKDGWKNVRRVAQLHDAHWIEPIGERCGAYLVEFSLHSVTIDSALTRLIANLFPALKHLDFRSCEWIELNAIDPISVREFGVRLRSLTFLEKKNGYKQLDLRHLLRLFPRLRHLGLHPHQWSIYLRLHLDRFQFRRHHDLREHFDFRQHGNEGPPPLSHHFSADLRSLYLSSLPQYSTELGEMLTWVQMEAPRIAALYLDNCLTEEPMLGQISSMKSLRFLHLSYSESPEALCICLNSLPQLIALQLNLLSIKIKLLPNVFRSRCFHGLVHLSLVLHKFGNFEPIGLLSAVSPNLRSLNLDITTVFASDKARRIGCEMRKMALNGTLEHLNVPCASFTIEELVQLVQLYPNLHSLGVQLAYEEVFDVAGLRNVVANQWRAGTRKFLPLRIWKYGNPVVSWSDSFLAIQTTQFGFAPPNPVLNALFRDEIFGNDNDGGGTPSFVTKNYSKGDC